MLSTVMQAKFQSLYFNQLMGDGVLNCRQENRCTPCLACAPAKGYKMLNSASVTFM